MKRLLFLLFFISFCSFSQEEIPTIDFTKGDYPIGEKVRINFNKDQRPTMNIDSALYYRLITFKEKNIPVGRIEGYYITGELYSQFYSLYYGLDSKGKDSSVSNGPAYLYHKNGNRSLAYSFMNGSLFGDGITYYESGEVEFIVNYVDDLKQGEEIGYYESGEVEYRVNFVDNLQQGEEIYYYESGEVIVTQTWVDGLVQGERIW